jgi:hypothetical protein
VHVSAPRRNTAYTESNEEKVRGREGAIASTRGACAPKSYTFQSEQSQPSNCSSFVISAEKTPERYFRSSGLIARS